jgi:GT2 family glycosyltransferase
MSNAAESIVTILIVPRERFSTARESLESILQVTSDVPYELVYVDGHSPKPVAQYLDGAAEEHDFTLIRSPIYLSPNQARNIGLGYVRTKYVVFVDNDIVVSPGWLSSMLRCAEETGAAIVTPIICEGSPVHQVIHCAGGEAGFTEKRESKRVIVRMHLAKRRVAEWRPRLARCETGLAEFHCMLVRKDVFARLGKLDEGFLNTMEQIDFSIAVRALGERIFLEPAAVVTYLFYDKPLLPSDYPYFMLRWSDAWEVSSLRRMMDKWQLPKNDYFENRIRNRGFRRKLAIWNPVATKLSFGVRNRVLSRALFEADRVVNRLVALRYSRHQVRHLHADMTVRVSSRAAANR